MNREIYTNFNRINLIAALIFLCSMFSFSAMAQDKPMEAKSLAGLIKDLKEVVSKNARNENDTQLIGKKWDARKDLTGKTKSVVINLLYNDVKAVIKDSGVQYQIYSIFSFYKQIPDEKFSGKSSQTKSFQDLTENEKAEFVAAKIDEISVKISGKKYPFDTNFKAQVLKYVESYARRIGNNTKNKIFSEDLNFVIRRGSEYAPAINAAFDKNGVSRLSGLYIAMIESEFNNDFVSPTGGSGAFILTAAQAQKYGMSKKDKAVLSKSAEIAARLLAKNQNYFSQYKMKEFLAILSWNREIKKINFDLNFKFMSDNQNIACPVCGLVGNPKRFDQQFQTEAVKYIPKFLAAAIVGENPADFGLNTKPLSTIGAENQ